MLFLLPWFNLQNKIVRTVLSTFSYIVFPLIFLGMIADIRFYEYFNIRFNFMAYEYTGSGGQNYVNADRLFWEFISIWFIASALFVYSHFKILKLNQTKTHQKLLSRIIFFFCFLIFLAVGIRGRIAFAPMDWGVAYFSDNHTLNQSALNGIYTLIKNYSEIEHDPRLSFLDESDRFPFVDQKIALANVQTMITQENSEFIDKNNSLKQTMSTKPNFEFQPNIIIVLMESWAGTRTSCLVDSLNLTPQFDSLTEHGILFENFYANGFRTNFGLAATLCSYPALPGRAILKKYESKHPFKSISEILHNEGYYNLFCYGGDIAFDNMEGFFRAKHFDHFYGVDDFDSDASFSKWGVPDELLFEKINHLVDSLPRPFQLSTLTISNHEPFDLPDSSMMRYQDDSFDSKKANAIIYADYAIGKFIKEMKTKPIFDSTIFLFVSDHAILEYPKMSLDPNLFHIPLLIYAPTLLGDSAVRISTIGSQVDIVPTLLGILGGNYEHESWGRDLLNLPADDSGFAFVTLWDRIGYLDNDYFYFEQIGLYTKLHHNLQRDQLFEEADTTEYADALKQMRERLRNYTQLADQLTLPASFKK